MFVSVLGTEYAERGDYVVYENGVYEANRLGLSSTLEIAIIVEFTLNNKLVVRKFASTDLFIIEVSQVVNIDRRVVKDGE